MSELISQSRGITQEEQRLYNHFLILVQTESPGSLLDRFRLLLIEGTGYPDAAVQRDFDRLVQSVAAQDFRFILNRCCHILINRWQTRPQHHAAIADLIALFETAPTKPATADYGRSRTVKQLRALIQTFQHTEQYLMLKRLSHVLYSPEHITETQPLGCLIRRYPYLYEHCLVPEGAPVHHKASIRQLQVDRQHQFEVDLSKYVTYQVRRSTSSRIVQPVQNPTLLDDRSLSTALQQFTGKIDGDQTCREVAQRFQTHCQQLRSYRDFKADLYHYLTDAVNPGYGRRHFNPQLSRLLVNTLKESESQPLTDFLIVRTCSQLLNFLVVESSQRRQHFVFIDLLSNLGATSTTRLLLQIVLLCRRVKPYLEKRFSILFSHYEAHSRDCVEWLVAVMETLHIALTTNFSTLNLCFVNQLALC